jgi:hypothetical protein
LTDGIFLSCTAQHDGSNANKTLNIILLTQDSPNAKKNQKQPAGALFFKKLFLSCITRTIHSSDLTTSFIPLTSRKPEFIQHPCKADFVVDEPEFKKKNEPYGNRHYFFPGSCGALVTSSIDSTL